MNVYKRNDVNVAPVWAPPPSAFNPPPEPDDELPDADEEDSVGDDD